MMNVDNISVSKNIHYTQLQLGVFLHCTYRLKLFIFSLISDAHLHPHHYPFSVSICTPISPIFLPPPLPLLPSPLHIFPLHHFFKFSHHPIPPSHPHICAPAQQQQDSHHRHHGQQPHRNYLFCPQTASDICPHGIIHLHTRSINVHWPTLSLWDVITHMCEPLVNQLSTISGLTHAGKKRAVTCC